MTYRDEIIKKIKSQYPYLSAQFGIKRIGIFGSVARQTETELSDIDLVVEFSKPIGFKFFTLIEHLESLLGKRVDLITKDGIKNIRIKRVSSEIEKDIIYV